VDSSLVARARNGDHDAFAALAGEVIEAFLPQRKSVEAK
jgi:hypothetical protein